MRIAMSLLSLRPGSVGGAETYVRQMVRELPAAAPDDHLLLVLDRDLARTLEAPGWEKRVIPHSSSEVVARRILEAYTPWRDRRLERLIDEAGAAVVFFPQQSIYPAAVRTPAVLTVVDVQHVFHPERFNLFDRTFRPRVYPRSLEAAEHVIAISEFTRRTLLDACGLEPGKVTAIPLGRSSRTPYQVEPHREPTPYLYFPAASFPHKGHDQLFRVLATLRRRGDLRHGLRLSGAQTTYWRTLRRTIRRLGLEDVVVHEGFVAPERVDALYAGADAIVFPSQYEGFGLPVIEANRFGRRIVTSQLPVFEEIGVPARLRVDFADPDAVMTALRDPGPWTLEKAPLEWSETARRTVELLRRVGARRTA